MRFQLSIRISPWHIPKVQALAAEAAEADRAHIAMVLGLVDYYNI